MFYDFITKSTEIFVAKREALHCTAKASHFFSTKKYWHILDINVCNFIETLTNAIVSFEPPGPEIYSA